MQNEKLKNENFNVWEIFRLGDFSNKEEIEKHAPEFLDENGNIDYETIVRMLFYELKRVSRIAKQNEKALAFGRK